jgi:hypothetical protein
MVRAWTILPRHKSLTERPFAMPELRPDDLLKTRSVDPRPRSNLATIASVAIALLALVCSTTVLCITTENQCNDRRDRRILQQPNVWLEPEREEGALVLVNSGPGAALIRESIEIYKGKPLPNPTIGGDFQDYRNRRLFSGEQEWLLGISMLTQLRDAALLCAGGKFDGCLRVGINHELPLANYVMSPGQRFPFLHITNLDEIKKRVSDDEFRVWKNMFGEAFPDDVDFRIEYCPLSHEFGPCRTLTTKKSSAAFPDLPTCKSGLAALLPSS